MTNVESGVDKLERFRNEIRVQVLNEFAGFHPKGGYAGEEEAVNGRI